MARKLFSDETRPHLAAYFNMACHNAFVVLSRISEKASKSCDQRLEMKLSELPVISLFDTKKPEEKEWIMNHFEKLFPFISPAMKMNKISEADYDDLQCSNKPYVRTTYAMKRCIVDIFNMLNFFRDKYTHYVFNDERNDNAEYRDIQKRVVEYLEACFTASCRIVKERFLLDKELEFLTKGRYERHGAKCVVNTRSPFALRDEQGMLSDMGILYFLCLFIEKQYVSMLFDQLGYKGYAIYENHSELRRKYIREIFSVYRIKLPRERMVSESVIEALGMDMLSDLKRCPEVLFKTISANDQAKFRIKAETSGEETLFIRKDSRFARLALQYIDEKHLFADIRFHVSLGEYRYKFYEKRCIDGDTRVRILQKDLNGFGRLAEIETLRTERWGKYIRPFESIEIDDEHTQPYITDQRAKYLFNGNRIGLCFNTKDAQVMSAGVYMPAIDGDNAPCVQPTCWLSVYEIPAMIFHLLLCKEDVDALKNKKSSDTESIIKNYVANYKRFFDDWANGRWRRSGDAAKDFADIETEYSIKQRDLPQKVCDYITGVKGKPLQERASAIVKAMRAENEEMIRRFDERYARAISPDNKFGKRSFIEIQPGRLAAFLAEDIVRFTPSVDGKDKPTGKNFSVLQSAIATYSLRKGYDMLDELRRIFLSAGIIGQGQGKNHPFLDKVLADAPQDTMQFYRAYLVQRDIYLRRVNATKTYTSAYFIHTTRAKWAKRTDEYYNSLAERYLSQPIELPRRLFEDDIKRRLIMRYPDMAACLQQESCNVAYMINCYMQQVEHDGVQSFYAMPRRYSCFADDTYRTVDEMQSYSHIDLLSHYLRGCKNNASEEAPYIEADARRRFHTLYKKYDDNERAIRRYMVQDILLFLMARDLLIKIKTDKKSFEEYRLQKVTPDGEGILEYKVPDFAVTLTFANGEKRTIRQHNLKVKNYGDFFKFMYDERVKTLLPQVESLEIDREVLEQELQQYDLYRPDVFRLILKLEQFIVEHFSELKQQRVQFRDILDKVTLNTADKEVLRLLRNAFSHNKYPRLSQIEYTLPGVAVLLQHIAEELVTKAGQ